MFATTKKTYIAARAIADLPIIASGTHSLVAHRALTIVTKTCLPIRKRVQTLKLLLRRQIINISLQHCDELYTAKRVESFLFLPNIATIHTAIRFKLFFCNRATIHTAIRVEPLLPQQCDDSYRSTRRARFRMPMLKRVFTMFNRQTI